MLVKKKGVRPQTGERLFFMDGLSGAPKACR